MNIKEIVSLPEECVMSALFSTDFEILEKEEQIEISIPQKSKQKKERINKKFVSSQKYKIKDKRILFKNVSRFDYEKQSDVIKRNDIFSSESVIETKYTAFVSEPELKEVIPFLAKFKLEKPYFYSDMDKYFWDPYVPFNFVFERILYNDGVLRDFYSKKPIYRPYDLIKIQEMKHLAFETQVFVKKPKEKVKTTIPANGKEFFYGKPIQRRVFCNGVYLYGAEGRGRNYYEYSGLEFKDKENKHISFSEIKEGIQTYDLILEKKFFGEYYSELVPAPWEVSFSEYGDVFFTEVEVEEAEDILYSFEGLPNFAKDTFIEKCCSCQNED